MTVDNLVSAEVVLADGRRVRASADEHPTCTGRCAAAAATSASSRPSSCACTSSGRRCSALNVAYPLEDAARVLAGWRDAVAGAPDELSTAGLHLVAAGRRRAARAAARRCRTSASPACGRATRPRASAPRAALRELATPLLDMSGPRRLPRLPALARPVLPGGPAPLLEGAVPRRALRRRDRHHGRLVEPPPVERHARDRPPLRRGDGPRRRRGDRVRRPQLGVDAEHRLDLGRPRRRRGQHRLHARVLGRRDPVLGRQDVLQLPRPARGGRRRRARQLRRQPRPAGAHQGRLRPGQPLPAQPEHPARGA